MEKMKRPLIVLLLLILAGSSYWVYVKYFSVQSSNLTATGTIEATTVNLNLKSSGTIKNLAFKEGDLVKKDQLLAELTRNDLAAQRERDALAVLIAEANLDDLISGARDQEIKQAVANLNIAQISLDQANLDLQRIEKLFEATAVSQQELDQANLNVNLKKGQVEITQSALNLLETGNRPAKISAAGAEVERTKAVLKATDAVLEDLKLRSPIDGTILSRNYEMGEYVTTGLALATIADLNNLWIKVYIPTDDLPAVKLGQKVTITVSGESTQFSGIVSYIASQGEFTPKTIQTKQERTNVVYAVKITVEGSNGILKPGMPADVIFDRS